MTATRTRTGRKTRRGPSPQTEARQAEIELAAATVNDDTPDYGIFRARWADRYSESNLARLWVQCPNATALHRFGTWRGLGRQVRTGEHAIWLRIPHNGFDPDKITEANPDGRVFHGAPWLGMFDLSQTSEIGDFDESAPGATEEQLAEVKRLRKAAVALHPDTTMADTAAEFMAAWAAYEQARTRLGGTS